MPSSLLRSCRVECILCHCMSVSERDVARAIAGGARTVDEIGELCEAGTGCGSCRGGIEVMLNEAALRRSRGDATADIWGQLGLFSLESE